MKGYKKLSFLDLPVFRMTPPPNLVPMSEYILPLSDKDLPEEVQEWLRCHPLSYVYGSYEKYARCPCCEEWTTNAEGCSVRQLVNRGAFEEAHALHLKLEWPANTGKKTTKFRGMKPDYRLVTFRYLM